MKRQQVVVCGILRTDYITLNYTVKKELWCALECVHLHYDLNLVCFVIKYESNVSWGISHTKYDQASRDSKTGLLAWSYLVCTVLSCHNIWL